MTFLETMAGNWVKFVGAALLAGLVVGWCSGRRPSGDVKAWENRVQAYQADSIRFEQGIRLLRGFVRLAEDSARVARERAIAYKAQADQLRQDATLHRKQADHLFGQLADKTSAADSLPVVVAAYEARTQEATTLRHENASLRDAFEAQRRALALMQFALDSATNAADSALARLAIADDLLRDRQTDRCRILWFDCPSRTTTLVVGAVAGFAGGLYVATSH